MTRPLITLGGTAVKRRRIRSLSRGNEAKGEEVYFGRHHVERNQTLAKMKLPAELLERLYRRLTNHFIFCYREEFRLI